MLSRTVLGVPIAIPGLFPNRWWSESWPYAARPVTDHAAWLITWPKKASTSVSTEPIASYSELA